MRERNRGVSAQLNSSHSSVTQPVGQPRNARRIQQIQTLHIEFQDLKKKIKDVQIKNQKIIQNIHKRYDFKKKPQTMEYMVDKRPIVYYQNLQDKGELSAENQSNQSNQSECEFNMRKAVSKKTSNIKKNINPAHHQSMEYRKTQHNNEQREPSEIESNKTNFNQQVKPTPQGQHFGYNSSSHFRPQNVPQEQFQVSQFSGVPPYQMSMQFPPYPSLALSQVESFYGNNNYQFEQLRREREKVKVLEKELQGKQVDTQSLKRLQKKVSNISKTLGEVIEQNFENFMQVVVIKRLSEIQRFVKKNQNKLKRLSHFIKDKQEETRSIRNISQHRIQRTGSRSKRDSSPKNNPTFSSLPRGPRKSHAPQTSNPADSSSAIKSKQSDLSKSSVKFQQIFTQYEEMIKVKNKELESSQQRLRQKERELIEMGAKCTKLELKLTQVEQIPKKIHRNFSSQKEDNLLSNLDFETDKEAQLKQLNKKIAELEEQAKKKNLELKQKDINLQKLNKKIIEIEAKSKKYENQIKRFKQQHKKIDEFSKDDAELQIKLRRLENDLQSKQKEFTLTKQKCTKVQNQKIQRECQNLTLNNKIKKIQSLLTVKQQKIQQLQKIIQSNTGIEMTQLLQKSIYLQKQQQNDIQNLQQEKEHLQQQITHKDEEIYTLKRTNENLVSKMDECQSSNQTLKKDVQTLLIQNESMKINLKAIEFQKYSTKTTRSPLQTLLQENDVLSQNEDSTTIREELDQMRNKYQQTQRQLKAQKHQSLQFNTKLIKMNSELAYYRDLLAQRQVKYQKLRKQYEQSRAQINNLQQKLQEKENEIQVEKKVNNQKITEIESQWLQFQQQMRNKDSHDDPNNTSDLVRSRNFSEESFINYRNTFNSVNAQNQHLSEKLKQAEKMIEIQKEMQSKIMVEYRSNVDKIKGQLRQKAKQNEQLVEDIQHLRRKIKVNQHNENRKKEMTQKDMHIGDSNSRAYELELELAEVKEINSRLAAVEQQLFKQIAQKEQQNQSLVRMISAKQRKVQQLQDIIQLKEMNFSSHISSSQHKSKHHKQSFQSNSSLRYSMLSNNPNKDKTMELQLSEAGESFFEQNQSIISNVSEVFGRDQFPYEKMQLRRVEQRRLFQKTAAYIKSLKKAIDQKNKKIKLLQKKIQSLRNSQLIRKDIYQIKQTLDLEPDGQDIFRDYYSVQNAHSNSQRYKFKQLEHETKLTIEENNLLNSQIESLQEELLKAQDQENSLMKLKDLYKEEIKTLIKKNQEQLKAFEDQMKKQRQKVQQNESVQRMEAIKQLFVKIMNVVTTIEQEGAKSKKKEQRKKELEDYTKIFCNFISLEQSSRQKMLSDIKR